MKDSLDFSWMANDTTPKFTWDDILSPGGVADQTFEVITPDPRDTTNQDIYFGIMEGGIILVVALFICTFFPKNK